MKKTIVSTFLFFLAVTLFAQVTEQESGLRKHKLDTIMGWKHGGMVTVAFSQVSLTNWAAGGDNSISGIGNANLFLNYAGEHALWTNTLIVGYGKQNVQGRVTKTDDRLLFTSKYGRKISESLYYAGMIDFKTQMDVGYSSEDNTLKISNFMAPAYLFASVGIDFVKGENISLYAAPVTSKTTFVLDQALADSGSFGLAPGEKIRGEFGGYVKIQVKYPVMENINLSTRLDLFSNYLDNPQNIDIDWGVDIMMKVNKWVTVTASTELIYDDNVKILHKNKSGELVYSPAVQFSEILGVGITLSF